jgi:hypothetical protein
MYDHYLGGKDNFEADRAAAEASTPIFLRTHADVTRFFDGFELADPGVVDINAWQTIGTPKESQTIGYGGVAIKPLAAMTDKGRVSCQ